MPGTQKFCRVFVVDDEPLIASTLAMIPCNQGVSFTDPCEALLATQSDAPDLLVSGMMMPLHSGIELAKQVQETCPNCKVLLFSGNINSLESMRNGDYHFEALSKPVHPAELLRKILSLTEGALTRR